MKARTPSSEEPIVLPRIDHLVQSCFNRGMTVVETARYLGTPASQVADLCRVLNIRMIDDRGTP